MDKDKNISPIQPGDNDARLKEDRMLAYLEGKLTSAEQHQVELWLADEGMEHDAIEGLGEMDAAERGRSINRLNHQLRKSIVQRSRKRRKPKNDTYILVAVFLILLLAVAAYFVVRHL